MSGPDHSSRSPSTRRCSSRRERVAVATALSDDVNLDPDADLLLDALRDVDVEGVLCAWDDATIDCRITSSPSSARRGTTRVIVRAISAWARSLERLCNPYPIIEYSTDKHYLARARVAWSPHRALDVL